MSRSRRSAALWHRSNDDDVTRLGEARQNQPWESTAVLGRRVWDQAASFEVRLGPLTLEQFLSFLPDGHALAPLVAVARFYVREELDFRLRLTLKAAEVPDLRLGAADGA